MSLHSITLTGFQANEIKLFSSVSLITPYKTMLDIQCTCIRIRHFKASITPTNNSLVILNQLSKQKYNILSIRNYLSLVSFFNL
jgi:trehalose-6-phosphatase